MPTVPSHFRTTSTPHAHLPALTSSFHTCSPPRPPTFTSLFPQAWANGLSWLGSEARLIVPPAPHTSPADTVCLLRRVCTTFGALKSLVLVADAASVPELQEVGAWPALPACLPAGPALLAVCLPASLPACLCLCLAFAIALLSDRSRVIVL